MKGKKIILHSETVYLIANLLLSFAVAMITCTDFGVSMIVAPAYIISQKFTFLTFGQSEYILQGILIIVFCLLMKKVKLVYFSSFVTCLIYGALLDMWRIIIPAFNPDITPAGSLDFPVKTVFFVLGMFLTAFSIALFFRTYFYPQVYDFCVKGLSEKFGFDRTKFKICYDVFSFTVAVVLTLVLFKKFVGVGVGTVIMTLLNGVIIGLCGKFLDKFVEIKPFFPKFAKYFDIV